MQLTTYLQLLADQWTFANDRTLVALGTVVVNDGKFFARIAAGTEPRTGTFEKFLGFFRDGANWPDGRIPQAAVDLLDGLDAIACAERSDGGFTPSPSAGASGVATGEAADGMVPASDAARAESTGLGSDVSREVVS
jgi:hypothetical protein